MIMMKTWNISRSFQIQRQFDHPFCLLNVFFPLFYVFFLFLLLVLPYVDMVMPPVFFPTSHMDSSIKSVGRAIAHACTNLHRCQSALNACMCLCVYSSVWYLSVFDFQTNTG